MSLTSLNSNLPVRLPRRDFIQHPEAQAMQAMLRDYVDGDTFPAETFTFVYGPTGAGKTQVVINAFPESDFFPRKMDKKDIWPIVYVKAPGRGSIKGLYTKILSTLGLPGKGSIDAMHQQVCGILQSLETKLLIIDEIHHIAKRNDYGAGDTIKSLVDELPCRLLPIGLYELVQLVRENTQLQSSRRLPPIGVRPFNWFDESDQKTYRDILHTTRLGNPELHAEIDISAFDLAGTLNLASGGLLGSTSMLLLWAQHFAKEGGRRAIRKVDLAKAFTEMHAEIRPQPDNPFEFKTLPNAWKPAPMTSGMDPKKLLKHRNVSG